MFWEERLWSGLGGWLSRKYIGRFMASRLHCWTRPVLSGALQWHAVPLDQLLFVPLSSLTVLTMNTSWSLRRAVVPIILCLYHIPLGDSRCCCMAVHTAGSHQSCLNNHILTGHHLFGLDVNYSHSGCQGPYLLYRLPQIHSYHIQKQTRSYQLSFHCKYGLHPDLHSRILYKAAPVYSVQNTHGFSLCISGSIVWLIW